MPDRPPHRLLAEARELREAARLSISKAAQLAGMPGSVLGSHERGDRRASLEQMDRTLAVYDRRLAIVPIGFDVAAAVQELVELRAFRDQVIADHHAAHNRRGLEAA